MQERQKTQFWSLGQEDPPQKEMSTQSSIFAWEIPWTEEPGWLQSRGLKALDMTEHACTHTHTHTFVLKYKYISLPWIQVTLNWSRNMKGERLTKRAQREGGIKYGVWHGGHSPWETEWQTRGSDFSCLSQWAFLYFLDPEDALNPGLQVRFPDSDENLENKSDQHECPPTASQRPLRIPYWDLTNGLSSLLWDVPILVSSRDYIKSWWFCLLNVPIHFFSFSTTISLFHSSLSSHITGKSLLTDLPPPLCTPPPPISLPAASLDIPDAHLT